jgi:hypothetical protein
MRQFLDLVREDMKLRRQGGGSDQKREPQFCSGEGRHV